MSNPTDRQWSFIERLVSERYVNAAEAVAVLRERRLTGTGAGAVIDKLLTMPKLAVAPTVAASANGRGTLPFNRYSGRCVLCQGEVAAQAGTYRRGKGGGWETLHLPGECPAMGTAEAAAIAKPRRTWHEIIGTTPDGYYAIPSVTGSNDLTFLRVGTNKGTVNPANKGKRFVKHIVGGNGEFGNLTVEWVEKAIDAINTLGPRDCQVLYGQEIGSCGRCGRELTDETSRARGLGPECAGRV